MPKTEVINRGLVTTYSPIWVPMLLVLLRCVAEGMAARNWLVVLPQLPQIIAFGGLGFAVWGITQTATGGTSRLAAPPLSTPVDRTTIITNELLFLWGLTMVQIVVAFISTFYKSDPLSVGFLVCLVGAGAVAYLLPIMYIKGKL